MNSGRPKSEELYELIQIECGNVSIRTIKKVFVGFIRVFMNQLKIKESIKIPKFGTFTITKRKEKIAKVGDMVNGGTKYVHIAPIYVMTFTPSSSLMHIINDRDFDVGSLLKRKAKNEKPKKITTETKVLADILANSKDRKMKREQRRAENGKGNNQEGKSIDS